MTASQKLFGIIAASTTCAIIGALAHLSFETIAITQKQAEINTAIRAVTSPSQERIQAFQQSGEYLRKAIISRIYSNIRVVAAKSFCFQSGNSDPVPCIMQRTRASTTISIIGDNAQRCRDLLNATASQITDLRAEMLSGRSIDQKSEVIFRIFNPSITEICYANASFRET